MTLDRREFVKLTYDEEKLRDVLRDLLTAHYVDLFGLRASHPWGDGQFVITCHCGETWVAPTEDATVQLWISHTLTILGLLPGARTLLYHLPGDSPNA